MRCLCAAITLALAGPAPAVVTVDLAPPETTYSNEFFQGQWLSGVGPARSFAFEDDRSFTLLSVGIEVNLGADQITTVNLYEFSGSDTVGPLLGTWSQAHLNTGRGWYDVPVEYVFGGTGERYLLELAWQNVPEEGTLFSFEGLGDAGAAVDLPYTVGPITVLDGKGSEPTGHPNFLLSHFRVVVPEPGTGLLVALGLAGLGIRGRKATNSSLVGFPHQPN